jgi:hypothetical protein
MLKVIHHQVQRRMFDDAGPYGLRPISKCDRENRSGEHKGYQHIKRDPYCRFLRLLRHGSTLRDRIMRAVGERRL